MEYILNIDGVDQAPTLRGAVPPSNNAFIAGNFVFQTATGISNAIVMKIRWRRADGNGTVIASNRIMIIDDL